MRIRIALLLSAVLLSTAPLFAAAVDLVIEGPTTANLNQPFQFTVRAIDGSGGTATDYTGTVTFSPSEEVPDPSIIMPGPYTFTPADQGVHTFTATARRQGPQIMNVHDVANNFHDDHTVTVACMTINPTYEQPVCPDTPPTLRVNASDPTASVTWRVGKALWSGHEIQGLPNYTGNYYVEAMHSGTGCTVSTNLYVTVQPPPTVTPLPRPLCDGAQYTISITNSDSAGPFTNLTWEVVNGTIISGQGTPEITFVANYTPLPNQNVGTTGVYLSSTTPAGCTIVRRHVESVPTYETHTFPISTVDQSCANTPQNASVFTPPGTHQWSITNGQILSTNGSTATYQLDGTGDAVLRVTWIGANGGCPAYGEKTIALGGSSSSLTINAPSTACPGVTQNASINGNPPGTHQWSITNGQILSTSGSSATYQLNGNGNAVLSVTSTGSGCQASGQRTITPGGTSTVTINTPPSACPGIEQTASVNGNPPGTYQWSITNGTITQNNGNNIRYTVNGNATLSVSIDSTSGCDGTGQASIAATGPTATIPTRNDDICAGETYAIPVALSGVAPFTVTWADGHVDSNITATSYSRVVSPDATTTYRIVAVHDANCSGSASGDVELAVSGTGPEITDQPDDMQVARGASATLTVGFRPSGASVQWYRGARGDRSNPVSGATSPTLRTPPLDTTTRFWAQVRTNCGTTLSSSATVRVTGTTPKRRSVRHR
ncbi:MAG TPA: hypothetical protein VE010_24300 [Thermoanaerobaculia bacterium]|nr:hypothetical protein [Thermoanaerobaculia bacterium]